MIIYINKITLEKKHNIKITEILLYKEKNDMFSKPGGRRAYQAV